MIVIVCIFFIICVIGFLNFIFGNDSRVVVNDNEEQIIFKASFTRGGSLIAPQKLIFDNKNVTVVTNSGIDSLYTTVFTQTIPMSRITGYKINRFLIGCNIIIIGEGYQNMVLIGFTGNDSDVIENMLKYIINN